MMIDAYTVRGGDGVVAEFERLMKELDWTNGLDAPVNAHAKIRLKQIVPIIGPDMSKILWNRSAPNQPFPY